MITARDLDNRLTYRGISSQGLAPFTYSEILVFASGLPMVPFNRQELVAFTTDLHTLLVQEGFDATYGTVIDSADYQDIWLQVAPGTRGIVRVIVLYDGHVDTDRDYYLPPTGSKDIIRILLDSLHGGITRQ